MDMKKAVLFLWILICNAALMSFIYGQSSCKVLKPQIAAMYTGPCEDGLANGIGEATGEDFYKGEFVKGLPDGKGTYIWKNGATYIGEWKKGLRNGNGTFSFKNNGRDSTLVGKWKNDKYLGNPNIPRYVIEYRNSIVRVSFMKIGERPFVRFVFSRNGNESKEIDNLLMQGSSGSETILTTFTGFEQVSFPFKGKVTFNAPNSFRTVILSCELRFSILEPGSWLVTMYY
jgi:hypothetical protein